MPQPAGRRIPISVPDQLGWLRIALVPVVMALVLVGDDQDYAFAVAFVVFVVAAASDFVDGYLARRWQVTSVLGAFLDTIADKLLVTGALYALVSVDRAWAWAAFIIVGREIVVMGLRGVAALEGALVPPSALGKSKAIVQFVAIGLAIVRLGEPWGPLFLDEWVMLGAVGISVWSGVDYVVRYALVRRPAPH